MMPGKFCKWWCKLVKLASAVWIAFLLYCMVWVGSMISTMDNVPVKIKGYRVGADNVVSAGRKEYGLVLLDRDMTRRCSVHIVLSLQTNSGDWPSDTIYDRTFSAEAVVQADKRTPGEFYFSFYVPENMPTGDAMIIGDASFECADNFVTYIKPSTLSKSFKIRIE